MKEQNILYISIAFVRKNVTVVFSNTLYFITHIKVIKKYTFLQEIQL